MKIKDIQIEGFGVWSGLSVDSLPDGMTVFYGPNEAGKTTLMQFFRAMLYGFTPERRSRYLPPVHGGRPGGAMRVTGPGGGYEISRRAQLNDPGVAGQLTVTSGDGLVQGQHRLAMLLGQVDESIFTNVFAIGLRELQELSTLDDTAAADELYKLSSGLDRVSLVDVMRQLRNARGQVVGANPDQGQMQGLMIRREKLRDEQDQLIGRGKRWGELASQKKSHQTEIDELNQRKEQWEVESKVIETSLQVRDPWKNRERIRLELNQLNARVELPDNSGQRLREIQAEIEDRKLKLNGLRDQRSTLRTRAKKLPVRRSIIELGSKIEAATEQAPWITALQKQIQRLQSDISVTRDQLVEDAKRLGVSEEDQNSLLNDKRMAGLPDLSRQAITQLAGPAREVRIQASRLKQAKLQGENDKKEAERLRSEIAEFLSVREQTDLHEAMQVHTEMIHRIRNQQQIEEKLEKLHRHRKELQEEAADLEAEDALPLERFFVLMIPFVFGAVMLLIGVDKMAFGSFFSRDPSMGSLLSLVGVVVLFFWYTWKNFTERGTGGDLNDCEGQLDGLVRQIKKTELERDELTRALPAFTGTPEQRLREYEHELQNYEAMLPIHHNLDAASQRFKSAQRRAKTSSEALKVARSQWKKTLQQLGLAESLSPKSIRIMAEGYESLLQTRKRLKTQEDELDQRKLELAAITQRVDALVRQAAAAAKQTNDSEDRMARRVSRDERSKEVRAEDRDKREERSREDRNREARKQDQSLNLVRAGTELPPVEIGEGAVAGLNDLTSMLAEQQAYIQQRKQLREEDEQLSKQQKAIQRSLDKLTLARQSLLADLGVENQDQLDKHLETKREYQKLAAQVEDLEERVRAIIGGSVPYDLVARNLDGSAANELDKRWDNLQQKIEQAEQRISQLHQRQGEISQEMKSLAADRRLPELKLELAVIDQQLKACAAHWQTLAGTTNMLEKVCEVYETERQPETLREASTFLKQLTEGKYVRVWTPLGKNALRIDNQQGQSLPLEVLSRGTREAVFIALRLSLAAAYARRGVMLPLVLDDVLVNFDTIRARQAAQVLRDYADLGNQVVMFTCHEHIMRMFHDISVQVRVLPNQGEPGEARIYVPESRPSIEPTRIVETVFITPEPIMDPPMPEPVVEYVERIPEPEPEPVVIVAPEPIPQPIPEPVVEIVRVEAPKKQKKARVVEVQSNPTLDHLWYELDPLESMWKDLDTPHRESLAPQELETLSNEGETNPEAWWTHA